MPSGLPFSPPPPFPVGKGSGRRHKEGGRLRHRNSDTRWQKLQGVAGLLAVLGSPVDAEVLAIAGGGALATVPAAIGGDVLAVVSAGSLTVLDAEIGAVDALAVLASSLPSVL